LLVSMMPWIFWIVSSEKSSSGQMASNTMMPECKNTSLKMKLLYSEFWRHTIFLKPVMQLKVKTNVKYNLIFKQESFVKHDF
jgi:hypothetical protein